ncbi:MAG: hypothetical protein ACLR7Z_03150 [Bilophila wadsworthia]
MRVLRADGTDTGIAFHGVPGGHEFNSFVGPPYNAAGPGRASIPPLPRPSPPSDRPLICKSWLPRLTTMCPELVIAAQKIAASNHW